MTKNKGFFIKENKYDKLKSYAINTESSAKILQEGIRDNCKKTIKMSLIQIGLDYETMLKKFKNIIFKEL